METGFSKRGALRPTRIGVAVAAMVSTAAIPEVVVAAEDEKKTAIVAQQRPGTHTSTQEDREQLVIDLLQEKDTSAQSSAGQQTNAAVSTQSEVTQVDTQQAKQAHIRQLPMPMVPGSASLTSAKEVKVVMVVAAAAMPST